MKLKITGIFIFSFSVLFSQIKETNISWSKIKEADGNLNLKLVKSWGVEDNGFEVAFADIADIAVDKNENYYFLDSGTSQILIFDKTSKLIKKIGRKGKGPGDFDNPKAIAIDNMRNILVCESGSMRIQLFDKSERIHFLQPEDVYYFFMKIDGRNLFYLLHNKIVTGEPKIMVYDPAVRLVTKVGKFQTSEGQFKRPHISEILLRYGVDNSGNVYIAYGEGNHLIEKYDQKGNLILKINYQLASAPSYRELAPKKTLPPVFPAGMKSMDTDPEGNTYLLVQKRDIPREEYEKYFDVNWYAADPATGEIVKEPTITAKSKKDNYDYFQIIVFDNKGNLKGAKTLNYIADEIKLSGGYLFVIQKNIQAVNQYKIF